MDGPLVDRLSEAILMVRERQGIPGEIAEGSDSLAVGAAKAEEAVPMTSFRCGAELGDGRRFRGI